jgi:tetratricopeptide (TPR) repeat protein
MGVIYLAERADEAFSKKVAIKFVRTDLLGGELTRRFRQEREILASLDHPAIARLLDAGTANVDVPFLVMEYVDGQRIDEYCAKRRLSVPDRLRLFLQVCDAVSYAHRRLVIHRDLKPGNILVDAEAVVKLLDFGIAKLTGPGSQPSDLTHTGIRPFTPDYASPEQVQGKNLTTASDIWALGTILYELLTGLLPFQKLRGNLSELERAICETDPLSPSAAVSAAAEGPSDLQDARKLRRQLSGDLDNIVLKAMAKEPERRYGSVEQLAEDINRHLAGEPVSAAPPSRTYRLRKFARKNRAWLAAGAAFALLLVAGVAAQTFELRRTTMERDRANRERDRATRVTDFMINMFASSHPSAARGRDVTAREILDKAANDIGTGLAKDPEVQAQMMYVMGYVYMNLGLYPKAEPLFSKALEIRTRVLGPENVDTLRSKYYLGELELREGRYAGAEKLERETVNAQRRVLGSDNHDTLRSINQLAWILMQEGHFDQAEKLHSEVFDKARRLFGPQDRLTRAAQMRLAIDFAEQSKYAEAEKVMREALEGDRRLHGADDLATLAESSNLSEILVREGKLGEAESQYRGVLQSYRRLLGPDDPETLDCLANLGGTLSQEGRYAEAEPMLRQALEGKRRVLGPGHSSTLDTLETLAEVLRKEKRYPEAEAAFRETLNGQSHALPPGNPYTATTAYHLAGVLAIEGKRNDALSQLQYSVDNGLPAKIRSGLATDADFKSLQGDPRFDSLVASAKRK